MPPRLIAVAFLVVDAIAFYAVPTDLVDDHATVSMIFFIALYLATGVAIGRWWALPLAYVPVLIAMPAGARGDADGTPLWWWTAIDTTVLFLWVMAAGVLLGWALRRMSWSRGREVVRG